MSMKAALSACAFLAFGVLAGCSQPESQHGNGTAAVAQVEPAQGNNARGKVTFTAVPGGLRVTADISGLAPGMHGFHVHEKGDCSAPDFTSAGDHFNPTGTKHGAREHQSAHNGDMGNVEADASGNAHVEYVDPKMKLEGESSVIGKAVVVHEKADDLSTQPSGNSGARIACGVIQKEGASANAKD
jgi:superoxide dismutase, Cu-Zn family